MSFKKVWDFIWKSDSWASWLVNIVLAFVIIKFLFYPGIGLLMGTEYPVVAVVSESMEHRLNNNNGNYYMCGETFRNHRTFDFHEWWSVCGIWYEENTNIKKQQFSEFKFRNGLNTGDIVVAVGKKPEDIEIGDVIIYQSDRPIPIIHRVVDIDNVNGTYYFSAKGDNNAGFEPRLDEERIHEDRVLGVSSFRIPYLGQVRLLANRILGF